MSFGRPQSFSDLVNTPPDRGSFPLDHYGRARCRNIPRAAACSNRECKEHMKAYLACLQKNGATSTPCRAMNKNYLECRMSKGLMERDDWHNLGLGKVGNETSGSSDGRVTTPPSERNNSA